MGKEVFVNTTSKTWEKLKKGKAYRDAVVTSQINVGIPFQIRALRKQQEMDQKDLAAIAVMAQPRISAMESPGYGSFTSDTLKRLAAAFDVALIVRFAPYSELVRQSTNFNQDDFEAHTASFEKDLEKIDALPQHVINLNALSTERAAVRISSNDEYPAAIASTTGKSQSVVGNSSVVFAVASLNRKYK